MLMSEFRFKWSILAIIAGLLYYVIALWRNVDGFEFISMSLISHENMELDESILVMAGLLFAFSADCLLIFREHRFHQERIDIYRATLDSTHHILNNFLNQTKILELMVAEDPRFDPEVLAMYQSTVNEALDKLSVLDQLETIDPKVIREVVSPDVFERGEQPSIR